MTRHVARFFDRLEDRVRGWFSHRPIVYGFIAGIGTVLFWRGVWHTADFFSMLFIAWRNGRPTTDLLGDFPDGPISFFLGSFMLLISGLFVSGFIGNEIIISGLRGEKKLAEKTEAEVKTETGAIGEIKEELVGISKRIGEIEKKLGR